jgi:DNA polymerase III sliding clamp (beta) subunit (PCNA family)
VLLYLPRHLACLAALAARDPARYGPEAVRVRDPGGGLYRAEATDGRLLAILRGPIPDADYPALDGHDPGEGAEVLVAREDWQRAFRLGDKARPVGLAVSEGELVLAVGDQALTVQPAEGRYPDVDQVLPRHGPLVAERLDPQVLAALLKVAAAVNPGGGVDLLYYGPGKPLGLMTRTDDGHAFDGLLMPLV